MPEGGVIADPGHLGTPSAFYSSSNCDIANLFTNQQLIFDITLCGDWWVTPFILSIVLTVLRAGNTLGEACPVPSGKNCYSTYVVGDPHNFAQAYCTCTPGLFKLLLIPCAVEIASLKVYAANSESSTSSTSSFTSTNSTSTSGSAAPSCSSTSTSVAGDTCDTLDKKPDLVSGTIKQANQFFDCGNIRTVISFFFFLFFLVFFVNPNLSC